MSTSKHICNSEFVQIGEMICDKCKKKIESGEFLEVSYYVSKRGNEDDYSKLYHRSCSENDGAWKKHDSDVISETFEAMKELERNKQKAIEMIRNAKTIEFGYSDEFISGMNCIAYE